MIKFTVKSNSLDQREWKRATVINAFNGFIESFPSLFRVIYQLSSTQCVDESTTCLQEQAKTGVTVVGHVTVDSENGPGRVGTFHAVV